jgi:hypothetical protein
MVDKNRYSDCDTSFNKYIDSYETIRSSETALIPAKPDEKNRLANFKGAFLEGLTNFNYYLSDTGVLGLLGVKKLDFNDSKSIVQLFDKKYNTYQKDRFLCDFERLSWFTYRNNFEKLLNPKNFPAIHDFQIDEKLEYKLYSDNGWGCMIRVAQMIMAQVLQMIKAKNKMVLINPDYFTDDQTNRTSICDVQKEIDIDNDIKREIIRLFLDNFRGEKAPFSIQNFVETGFFKYNKKPGDWYGVNSAAILLETLNNQYRPNKYLEVVVFNDAGIKQNK